MLNAEFYKDRLLEIANDDSRVAMVDGELKRCSDARCDLCDFDSDYEGCPSLLLKWLLAEHKKPYKITLLGKMVLEKLLKKYEYVARDEVGTLYAHGKKPCKGEYSWRVTQPGFVALIPRDIVDFPSVKWEDDEPTKISDILKNYEIVPEGSEE